MTLAAQQHTCPSTSTGIWPGPLLSDGVLLPGHSDPLEREARAHLHGTAHHSSHKLSETAGLDQTCCTFVPHAGSRGLGQREKAERLISDASTDWLQVEVATFRLY